MREGHEAIATSTDSTTVTAATTSAAVAARLRPALRVSSAMSAAPPASTTLKSPSQKSATDTQAESCEGDRRSPRRAHASREHECRGSEREHDQQLDRELTAGLAVAMPLEHGVDGQRDGRGGAPPARAASAVGGRGGRCTCAHQPLTGTQPTDAPPAAPPSGRRLFRRPDPPLRRVQDRRLARRQVTGAGSTFERSSTRRFPCTRRWRSPFAAFALAGLVEVAITSDGAGRPLSYPAALAAPTVASATTRERPARTAPARRARRRWRPWRGIPATRPTCCSCSSSRSTRSVPGSTFAARRGAPVSRWQRSWGWSTRAGSTGTTRSSSCSSTAARGSSGCSFAGPASGRSSSNVEPLTWRSPGPRRHGRPPSRSAPASRARCTTSSRTA